MLLSLFLDLETDASGHIAIRSFRTSAGVLLPRERWVFLPLKLSSRSSWYQPRLVSRPTSTRAHQGPFAIHSALETHRTQHVHGHVFRSGAEWVSLLAILVIIIYTLTFTLAALLSSREPVVHPFLLDEVA